jgi:hypothetical protein
MVHSRLHRRFEKPRAWYRIVYENYRHGAWFTLLTMNPESMIVPYTYLYPNYLPGADDAWGDMADDLGIHREMFNPNNDELVGLWMPQPGLWNIERNERKRAHG